MHQTGWTALVVDLVLDPPGAPVATNNPRRTRPGFAEQNTN